MTADASQAPCHQSLMRLVRLSPLTNRRFTHPFYCRLLTNKHECWHQALTFSDGPEESI